MNTLKAGCFLINLQKKEVALVYRVKQNDYSFPKGHCEEGESLTQCAIRETAEETKRIAKIIDSIPPVVQKYSTPRGEDCECYMYLATDEGASDNDSTDSHPTVWVDYREVNDRLSYENLRIIYAEIYPHILNLFA